MAKRNKVETKRWVTVAMDDDLHGAVRAKAVRDHLDWHTVIAEAMRLWLAHRTSSTA